MFKSEVMGGAAPAAERGAFGFQRKKKVGMRLR
jgi:hypothetical protein